MENISNLVGLIIQFLVASGAVSLVSVNAQPLLHSVYSSDFHEGWMDREWWGKEADESTFFQNSIKEATFCSALCPLPPPPVMNFLNQWDAQIGFHRRPLHIRECVWECALWHSERFSRVFRPSLPAAMARVPSQLVSGTLQGNIIRAHTHPAECLWE